MIVIPVGEEMIYTALTKKAMILAYRLHKDQIDKGGVPYVFHSFHLAEQMTTEETTVVALLHDVLEDTGCTIQSLLEQGFPQVVTDAITILTHDKAVTYQEYIRRIKENPIAKPVKLADLRHNSDLSRLDFIDEKSRRRTEKYRQAIELLTAEDGSNRKGFPPMELQPVFAPDEAELSQKIEERDRILVQMGYRKDSSGRFSESKKEAKYFRLISGVILKIDYEHLTCYRFDPVRKEWNQDGSMFSEYEYGSLDGELISFPDHYPIGKPFSYKDYSAVSDIKAGGEHQETKHIFPDLQTLRSKIAASLYGGALGDALGYEIEFESWKSVQARFGCNGIDKPVLHDGLALVSDDTQMTLFTAEGIGYGYFRAEERGVGASVAWYIYQAYLCWLQTQGISAESLWDPVSSLMRNPAMIHRRAPGNTCLNALSSGKQGTIKEPINNSKGCGGVMRTAPLGFIRHERNNRNPFGSALDNGAETAAITHGNPLGWLPAGMLADVIDRCIYEQYDSLKELIEASLAAVVKRFSEYQEVRAFRKLIERAITLGSEAVSDEYRDASADEAAIRSLGEGWVGEEALAIAIYAVLRYPRDLKKALAAAVNHDGDSDSTGAIAGNILGAYLGMKAIPKDWSEHLELSDAIEETVDLMMRVIQRGIIQ